MAENNNPKSDFPGKNAVNPRIVPRDKFRKKVTVPKSGKVTNNQEGTWGRNG